MKERCQIIENAKVKAKERGLDHRMVRCPADDICVETECLFDGKPLPEALGREQIEKFKARFKRKGVLTDRIKERKNGCL